MSKYNEIRLSTKKGWSRKRDEFTLQKYCGTNLLIYINELCNGNFSLGETTYYIVLVTPVLVFSKFL